MKDGDLRILGARDGYAHALIDVRHQIGLIDGTYAPRILPHHKKKRAARDAILRPLKDLERKFAQSHADCQAAYHETTKG